MIDGSVLEPCPRCGGPQAETGPPINDIYCLDNECFRGDMIKLFARMCKQERRECERLKHKDKGSDKMGDGLLLGLILGAAFAVFIIDVECEKATGSECEYGIMVTDE